MTTNEQRDTAAILQMREDLDEARELLEIARTRVSQQLKTDISDFLARTEHETANR